MGADICNRFALLPHVEKRRRSKVHLSTAVFDQRMDVFELDGGMIGSTGERTPKDVRVLHQLSLNLVDEIEAFRHPVIEREMITFGGRERFFKFCKLAPIDDPGLVHKHILAAAQAGENTIDLQVVGAGDYRNVAWRLL